MSFLSVIPLILCIVPAVAYGWGMRGTTIGGEKGAMLPGAIIGLLLSVFSGVLIVRENFMVFSALGAIAMYFGGSMSYGETLGLSMNSHPPENMKKGLVALFIKGFLWFSSFGCIFSTGVNAISKFYLPNELALIFTVTPVVSILCYIIFNKPVKPEEKRFPFFYFSKTRQESWGSLLGITFSLIMLAVLKKDLFSTVFPLICGVFGGAGWVLGQLAQIYLRHYAGVSDNKLIHKLYDENYFEPWKAMECILGAFGGLGAAIGFIITYTSFKNNVLALEKLGGLKPYSEKASDTLLVIWAVFLILDMVHYFIKEPKNDKKLIVTYSVYKKTLEPTEFVLYAALPFVMICLGSVQTANLMAVLIMFLVIAQEIAFETELPRTYSIFLKIILSLCTLVILILQLIPGLNFNVTVSLFLYTVIYEVLTLAWLIPEIAAKYQKTPSYGENRGNIIKQLNNALKQNKAIMIVHIFFIICIVSVLLITNGR